MNSVIGLSFERPYWRTGLNLIYANFMKSTVKSEDFSRVRGCQWNSSLSLEQGNIKAHLPIKVTPYISFSFSADVFPFCQSWRTHWIHSTSHWSQQVRMAKLYFKFWVFVTRSTFISTKATPFLFVGLHYTSWYFSDRRSQKKKIGMVKNIITYCNFSNFGNICKWLFFDKLSDINVQITLLN